MPTYDYHCSNCDKQLEIFQKITAEPIRECPECGQQTLDRGPGGGAGLLFHGPGFYINDYGSGKQSTDSATSCKPKSDGSCCPCGKQ